MGIPREIVVNIGGKNYPIVSDDNYLEHIKNGFEPETVGLLRAAAGKSKVILDVGANIGCTALLFGESAEKVYAFEPAQTTYGFLKKNILTSQFKNIFPQNMGLGAEQGEFELTTSLFNRSGAYVSNRTQASTGHVIEKIVIRKMDEVLAALKVSKVDFIKIDVEGFEGMCYAVGRKRFLLHARMSY